VTKHKVPNFALLAWSALFLSLGWNFLEFGLDAPDSDGGLAWGWLVCAIVFAFMGALPAAGVIKPVLRSFFGDPESEPQTAGGLISSTFGTTATMVRQKVARTPSPTAAGTAAGTGEGSELVGELERLAAMHRSGALSDAEFEAAKRRIITEGS
jgi:hypothetical protein